MGGGAGSLSTTGKFPNKMGRTGSLPSLSRQGPSFTTKGSLPWLQSAAIATNGDMRTDDCYRELLLADPKVRGPGPPGRWAQNHAPGHTCLLKDILLVSSLRAAYEVGFCGEKARPPTEEELKFPEMAISPRLKSIAPIEELLATCDRCGVMLVEPEGEANDEEVNQQIQTAPSPLQPPPVKKSEFFYYCRKCKKNGHRFELCLSCHAITVLQAEGKHCGLAPHPHYLRCEHNGLLRRRDMRDAYPGTAHFRRPYCDHCGKQILADPNKGKFGAVEVDDAIYVCERCPEVHGVRFEMCSNCAYTLLERGAAVKRIGALAC